MKIVILDSATLGGDIDLSPIYELGEVTQYLSTTADEVMERIRDAEVVILNKIKLGADNLCVAKQLKLICVTATGYDNIDTQYCASRGISLYNVPKYSTDSVAQITAAMALSLASHLRSYERFVSSGEYTASGIANRLTPVYHELSSMTWGIVGGGAIGSRVAEIATSLGCRVLICRRQADSRYRQVDIDTLCAESDIISLHVPLNDGTRGMIGRERISKMKAGAILINVSRGAVCDEAALADAIESGRLGGLGIDVYGKEPLEVSSPLYRLLGREDVCLTPHMAWGSVEARARCVRTVADNIRSYYSNIDTNKII